MEVEIEDVRRKKKPLCKEDKVAGGDGKVPRNQQTSNPRTKPNNMDFPSFMCKDLNNAL